MFIWNVASQALKYSGTENNFFKMKCMMAAHHTCTKFVNKQVIFKIFTLNWHTKY